MFRMIGIFAEFGDICIAQIEPKKISENNEDEQQHPEQEQKYHPI